jgi:hypothetical protein
MAKSLGGTRMIALLFWREGREYVSRRKAKEQRALGADIRTETM